MVKKKINDERFNFREEQAIINHNKAILQTNCTLQKMQQEINEVKSLLDRYSCNYKSHTLKNTTTVSRFSDLIENFTSQVNSNLNRFYQDIKKVDEKIPSFTEWNSFYKKCLYDIEQKIEVINKKNDRLNTVISDQKDYFENKFYNFSSERNVAELSIKEKIEKKDKEIEAHLHDISNTLEDLRSSQRYVLDSVEIFKKKLFWVDKHIEFILNKENIPYESIR